jgi:hypothetical protein
MNIGNAPAVVPASGGDGVWQGCDQGAGLSDGQFHEDLRRQGEVKRSSERSFGIVFAVVFLLAGLLPLRHGAAVRWWALALALAFGLAALFAPRVLAPLNKLWARLGDVLHRVTTPLIMGLLFYGALTPWGTIMRIAGKDPLRLKRPIGAASYWIERKPPGPAPDSLNQAF